MLFYHHPSNSKFNVNPICLRLPPLTPPPHLSTETNEGGAIS